MTPHGSRSSYVAGCRCPLCARAEATYKAQLRRRKLTGRIILGAIISAQESKRLLNQLHREEAHRGDVAKALHLKSPQVKVHTRITVRKAILIKRLHLQWMSDPGEIQA